MGLECLLKAEFGITVLHRVSDATAMQQWHSSDATAMQQWHSSDATVT